MEPSLESSSPLLLQTLWDKIRAQEDFLRSPLFPVLFSMTLYLSCCLPYMCLDTLSSRVALVHRYKIQSHSRVTWAMAWSCLATSLHTHAVFIFPLSVLHWYWRPVVLPAQAPGALRVAWDVLACLLLFDLQYFVWHVLHHKVPWLYRTFHKVHHRYTATFALTTEHSGIWETLSLGLFAAVNPNLLGCHPLTKMLFFTLNIWLSVEDHSGYDLPWAPHRLVPFGLYGGSPHHDLHHLKFMVNYAPYFTHWDRLFGTLLHTDKPDTHDVDVLDASKRCDTASSGVTDVSHAPVYEATQSCVKDYEVKFRGK
ncbi:cholesterol 25-hydroxylase-like protein [Salvelinus namaycush]|uniref:Cholesterol 25-hydroxylase-like protein n=1 Tax=Salvelinus namaycush TaxID=8040 RepID=A0A8U0P3X3_SALNM|nr:cholesterol 25-hydroxylase-like protein [Salvelinus namaycush]